jgi:putative transposase
MVKTSSKRSESKKTASKSPASKPTFGHGGARKGAGRKPNGEVAGVSHLARPSVPRDSLVHVVLKFHDDVASLRSKKMFAILTHSLESGADLHGSRIVQYSIGRSELHLLVEASSNKSLSKTMQGFSIRVARGVNRSMVKKGRVFADRFHSKVLATPAEVREARSEISTKVP